MINEVRNTVLALLNKNNNGYLTPEEFNLLAKQAQLEIVEEYFYNYNAWINKRNARLSNSGYTNLPKQYAEVIDTLTREEAGLTYDAPTTSFTLSTDWYTINTVIYNSTPAAEVERVEQHKILQLLNSNITAPNTTYPAYYITGASTTTSTPATPGNSIKVYPDTIILDTDITVRYVRYPKAPNWTYQSIGADGDPLFDASNADYQDFELPEADGAGLILKILEYAGVVIREAEVVQYAQSEEAVDAQQDTN